MLAIFVILLASLATTNTSPVATNGSDTTEYPPECKGWFRTAHSSTMCLFDNPNVTESGMTKEQEKEVLDLHNELRSKVMPPATNMRKMVWHESVAAVAQKWAKQCITGHDDNRNVEEFYYNVGQNVAGGFNSWNDAVMAWYNEHKLFTYGKDLDSYTGDKGWGAIAHYTQVVQAKSVHIGCGYAKCTGSKYPTHYVCNYGPGQSFVEKPYIKTDNETERCSKCPQSCKDGLCDCGGKFCHHKGILNLNTCSCTCRPLYSGDLCDTLNCPEKDHLDCWVQHLKTSCQYDDIKAKCPFMCGVCGGPGADAPPPLIVSSFNCKYRGRQAYEEQCLTFGERGLDKWPCKSVGGTYFGCEYCYQSIKNLRVCPVMCGICNAPCNGKTCANGGSLDTHSCQCSCVAPFKGNTCEEVDCPYADQSRCGNRWPEIYCTQYRKLIVKRCPYMCGVCKEGDGPCNGLKCQNGGTLDQQSCHCNCPNTHKGERCHEINCPEKDVWACGTSYWPPQKCNEQEIVREYCPYMCGTCHK